MVLWCDGLMVWWIGWERKATRRNISDTLGIFIWKRRSGVLSWHRKEIFPRAMKESKAYRDLSDVVREGCLLMQKMSYISQIYSQNTRRALQCCDWIGRCNLGLGSMSDSLFPAMAVVLSVSFTPSRESHASVTIVSHASSLVWFVWNTRLFSVAAKCLSVNKTSFVSTTSTPPHQQTESSGPAVHH